MTDKVKVDKIIDLERVIGHTGNFAYFANITLDTLSNFLLPVKPIEYYMTEC